MNKHSLTMLLLIVITLFGASIRTFQLGTNPGSALIDEAHFGYIAYSLLETGKDEHGVAWPLLFKGFGDQKLPLYTYALLPWIKLFGLSVGSIRIPSLLAGIVLIPGVYWLVYEVFKSKRTALLGAFVTAVSPWPFFLSRFGFEANLSLTFFVFGLASGLHFLKKPSTLYAVLTGSLLAITWYGYIAFRPVSGVIIVFILLWGILTRHLNRRMLLVCMVSFGLLVLPWFLPGAASSNNARFSQVGILSDSGIPMEVNEKRAFCSNHLPKTVCYLTFNKPVLMLKTIIERYLSALSPNYLVVNGENDGTPFLTLPRYGQFAPILYILFIVGIAVLFRYQKIATEKRLLILLGLFTGLIPTILADAPQKVRLTPWYPFVLATLCAGYFWLTKLKINKKLKQVVTLLLITASLMHLSLYLVQFVSVHFDQFGHLYQNYVPATTLYIESTNSRSLVVIKPFYSDPLMFHAFYSKEDPSYYQQNARLGNLEASGFQHTIQVGRLMAIDLDPIGVACEAVKQGYVSAYLITNVEYNNLIQDFEFKSSNQVNTLIRSYIVPLSMCQSN